MVPEHLQRLTLQPAQAHIGLDGFDVLCEFEAFTGLDGDEVLGCAGLIPQGNHRALLWALVGNVGPRRFVAVHKAVLHFLSMCSHARLETWVDDGFEQGIRWAGMLGFVPEGLMKKHRPDGGDAWLYARVQ